MNKQIFSAILVWPLVYVFSGLPVTAANPANPMVGATAVPQQSSNLVDFAHIAKDAPGILLVVEGVKVNIRHKADATDVSVASNCPGHWAVKGNIVRQVALSTTQRGVSVRADALGGQAIVNGRIYQLPKGSDGTIRNLKIENGVVTANGQPLEPLVGSSVPGDCTGPDTLEVTVPTSYQGGLELYCQGASVVDMDDWQGGSLIANLGGTSQLTTGRLQKLAKVVVDVLGGGKAQIKELSARVFVANINGSGSVTVDSGSADMSNATVSGTGTMTIHGKFANLKKAVTGTGTITVLD